MGACLRAYLRPEADHNLLGLQKATTVPQGVKDRAAVVRLSHQG